MFELIFCINIGWLVCITIRVYIIYIASCLKVSTSVDVATSALWPIGSLIFSLSIFRIKLTGMPRTSRSWVPALDLSKSSTLVCCMRGIIAGRLFAATATMPRFVQNKWRQSRNKPSQIGSKWRRWTFHMNRGKKKQQWTLSDEHPSNKKLHKFCQDCSITHASLI